MSSKKQQQQQQRLNPQEAAQQFQARRSELQAIATKIGELESEADEHKLVIDTLRETQAKEPNRTCFRLIGGILVERTVKDVLPALEGNMAGLRQIMDTLVKQYKEKEEELREFQKQYGAPAAAAASSTSAATASA
ncbi:Cochaperone prefoldin complex subunit [Tilletia horrida]|uniref:Cochaperone prefoldin complex subunit n=1 Tax=Tilletia horrida TaxID=155126 RepID=A0AAN6JTM8_9BASI|nr:Cochaperone prefoldin complex subunit [Tilletia horrida]KAK0539516.1 Cochaperone prefoldin complex subunit [Tilletia horrida]KAK0565984.1 Cochaperone prefoldin complex subunit [Tilletia horrida]